MIIECQMCSVVQLISDVDVHVVFMQFMRWKTVRSMGTSYSFNEF
jgi:hypothetical protein